MERSGLMDIVIREANREDTELLRRIEAGDGYPYPYKKTNEDYEKYMDEGDEFFIAEADDAPAGYISMVDCIYLGRTVCRLHLLAVLKEYQGKGIGTRLIQHFEEQAKSRGYHRIIINVYQDNEEAIKFYEGKGYRHWFTIPYRYEKGIDAYVMFKDIGQTYVDQMKAQEGK